VDSRRETLGCLGRWEGGAQLPGPIWGKGSSAAWEGRERAGQGASAATCSYMFSMFPRVLS
jgi:hypothetical protein